jgi:hypothetical protein
MFLVYAGNSAIETVRLASARLADTEFAIFDATEQQSAGFRTTQQPNSGLGRR